jgi:chromosomal replication initiator protein
MINPIELISQAASLYGLSPTQLVRRTRIRHVVHARHVAMYLLKQRTEMSLHEIGSLLGGYDHTTVMYGIAATERRLIASPGLANEVASLVGDHILLERSDPVVARFLAECNL